MSFNINSIRARLEVLSIFLKKESPDFLFLQEIKCQNEQFPYDFIEEHEYSAMVVGQKSYNGVAILFKKNLAHDVKLIKDDLEILDDVQARFCHITYQNIHLINIYVPNGNPAFDDDGTISSKLQYKIEWLNIFVKYVSALREKEQEVLIGGDFNICPYDKDCFDAKHMEHDALLHPSIRDMFFTLQHQGLFDVFDSFYPDRVQYTYWDYVKGRFEKNHGLRIDHFLASPWVMDQCKAITVDEEPRHWTKPSDHTPLIFEMEYIA